MIKWQLFQTSPLVNFRTYCTNPSWLIPPSRFGGKSPDLHYVAQQHQPAFHQIFSFWYLNHCMLVSILKVSKWNIHIWNFVQRHPQKSFDVFKFNAGQSSPDNLLFSISVDIPILLIYTAQKSKTKYKLSLFASYFMIGCERMLGLSCVFHIYLDTNTHTIYPCLSYLS